MFVCECVCVCKSGEESQMFQWKRLTYGTGLRGPQEADRFQQRTLHGTQTAQLAYVSLGPEG